MNLQVAFPRPQRDPALVIFPGGASNNWDADENKGSDWMETAQ